MAGGREAYLALLAGKDPKIQKLLDDGYEFVTNAFRPGAKPSGFKAKEDREIVRELQRQGYEVELWLAYDERGTAIATMSSIWRRKRA
ncbi:MAG: hypothetical protein HY347_07805 [candidate division NC10 bacterium]|nr:hypothetical protein [candidate division NC10 bacterium]